MRNLIAASSEFFLGTISGPNFVERTRTYKDIVAACSISTYPILNDIGRAGDPIADYYYIRIFGSAIILSLADGCNWGEAPKLAASLAASNFVGYIQNRLHLCKNSRTATELIINAFSVAHYAIVNNNKQKQQKQQNIWDIGTCTLLGALLIPILDSKSVLAYRELQPLTRTEDFMQKKPRNMNKSKSHEPFIPPLHKSAPSAQKHGTTVMFPPKRQKSFCKSSPRNIIEESDRLEIQNLKVSKKRSRENENSTSSEKSSKRNKIKPKRSGSETSLAPNIIKKDSSSFGGKMQRPQRKRSNSTHSRSKSSHYSNPKISASSVPTSKKKRNKEKWALLFGSVGDCKIFIYNSRKKIISDVTYFNKENIFSDNDCGGRLGPYTSKGAPDMRNFNVSYCSVRTDDIVILVSDGVHDNLDPQYLGISPRTLRINSDSWDSVEANVANRAKRLFREQKLLEVIKKTDFSPKSICDTLTEYCKKVTRPSRIFMQKNPSLELPGDFTTYPGKMDHTTVICVKIDNPATSASTQLLRNAFTSKKDSFIPK